MLTKIKEQVTIKTKRILSSADKRPVEVLVEDEIEKHNKGQNKKTILYIGIKYDYGHKSRGLSFEHYNFYKTFENMDYSLIYFDYDRLKQKYGNKKMSEILRELVYIYNPDFLFYFHFKDWISHDVLNEISNELPTKTIIWLADDHWRYEDTKSVWKLFNLVVTTDKLCYKKRIKEGFKNVHLSQWACNHFLYENFSLSKKYDVSFVGQCYGKRKEFVDVLRKEGIKIETFGRGWKNSSRLSQADLIKIFNQSKISLNISFASKGERIQIKGRDFEAPGCGGLLVTAKNDTLEEYFDVGKEIITYKDVKDAAKKIKYYLEHEDELKKISQKGYNRIIKEHTFEKRFKKILEYW